MTKTRMSQEKRKQLMQYLPLYLKDLDKRYDFNLFYETQIAQVRAMMDEDIEVYYGKQWVIMQDFLKSKGVSNHFEIYLHSFDDDKIPFSAYRHDSFVRSNHVISDRIYTAIEGKDESFENFLNGRRQIYNEYYTKNLQAFMAEVKKVADPFIKLINSAKNCEDISNVWEDSKVFRILFPDKIQLPATISCTDLAFIKNINKKVQKKKKEEKNVKN